MIDKKNSNLDYLQTIRMSREKQALEAIYSGTHL